MAWGKILGGLAQKLEGKIGSLQGSQRTRAEAGLARLRGMGQKPGKLPGRGGVLGKVGRMVKQSRSLSKR